MKMAAAYKTQTYHEKFHCVQLYSLSKTIKNITNFILLHNKNHLRTFSIFYHIVFSSSNGK